MPEPAPNPPPTDTVRVALSGFLGAVSWVNVFWLKFTTSGTRDRLDLVNIAQSIFDLWPTTIGNPTTDGNHLTALQAKWYTGAGSHFVVDIEGDHTGAGTAGAAPGNVAGLILWQIAAAYRGGHPRSYICGVGETEIVDERYLSAAERASLQSHANSFLNGINILTHGTVTEVQMGTVSFFRHHLALDPPVFHPYLVAACSRTIATQRRRVRPR